MGDEELQEASKKFATNQLRARKRKAQYASRKETEAEKKQKEDPLATQTKLIA
jgi:hypothetical protein